MRTVPVNTPVITAADRLAVQDCLLDGWVSSEGPAVRQLEERFASQCARAHGVAVSSGTAALDIALRALDLKAGDEVLLPSFTIISCAQAILNAGATPVPVDCDPTHWNAELVHFQSRVSSRTRAIMLVHIYGLCADLGPILDWAASSHLAVIEDTSQALGVQYAGRPCGSFGLMSIASLYANKLVTTGEGGMILCDDPDVADRCRSLRNLCFGSRRFVHTELGWNYRMTSMQAALGVSQLGRWDQLVERKKQIGARYREALAGHDSITVAPDRLPHTVNGWWVFGMVVNSQRAQFREALTDRLSSRGVGTRPFFWGMHEQPAVQAHITSVQLPATEHLARRGFYLPSGLGLADEDQDYVIEQVIDCLEQVQ